MGILFLLFAVMPIVEIALLIQVGDMIGGWNTVGIVILTAFIGAYLVKREGISTLSEAQRKLQMGQVPGEELSQGLLLVVAGVLLVTPGFVTDIVGMLFTLPPTRKLFGKALLTKLATSPNVQTQFHYSGGFQQPGSTHQQNASSQSGDTFEGEFYEHDTQASRNINSLDEKNNKDSER